MKIVYDIYISCFQFMSISFLQWFMVYENNLYENSLTLFPLQL